MARHADYYLSEAFYYKRSDNSGPYFYDGTTFTSLGGGGGTLLDPGFTHVLDENDDEVDWLTKRAVFTRQEDQLPTTRWSYAAATAGILNTTTAVTVKAADAALSIYITSIQISSEALTTATEVAIRDGAGGTVLWRTKIGTGGLVGGREIVFSTPLKGTAATLLEVVTLTASGAGAVYFNAQGFVAA